MEITPVEITVADLALGYRDDNEGGVFGYSDRLDIRPPYQREFVYKDDKRNAVIDTVFKGFPLNVMYWATRDDGTFEVIDGQQRTISICQYVKKKFAVTPPYGDKPLYFQNLTEDQRQKLLDYKLTIYQCDGTESEKLDWFKTINIAGERLTEQELRNAVYSGPWVTDAKRYFSKINGPAYGVGGAYLDGEYDRQKILETVIRWISNDQINDYMGQNSKKPDAKPLWEYFQSVISWVQQTFPKYRKDMKGLDWGGFHREYGQFVLDPAKLEAEVAALMANPEIESKKGIYAYVLTRKEKHLNLRTFRNEDKTTMYERQKGICPICKQHFAIDEMEADHITPWHKGGKTDIANGQMLCREDNRAKGGK